MFFLLHKRLFDKEPFKDGYRFKRVDKSVYEVWVSPDGLEKIIEIK